MPIEIPIQKRQVEFLNNLKPHFIFSFVVAFVSKANAYSKRWIWSTTWNDPKNWDKQSLPCSKDSIILSEVYLQTLTSKTFSGFYAASCPPSLLESRTRLLWTQMIRKTFDGKELILCILSCCISCFFSELC